MEIDYLKSATDYQMEMMTKSMMQVDDLPEFHYNDVVQLPPSEQLVGATSSIETPQLGSLSPPFINLQTDQTTGSKPVHPTPSGFLSFPQKKNSMAAMREMIFRIAAMQPVHIDPESVKPPKRRNVKISKDPQSVAARHRRERISERIRILQRLVPGGTKMDTASMLDEAIHYVKFLKSQVQSFERAAAAANNNNNRSSSGIGFPVAMSNGSFLPYQLIPQRFGDAN